MPSYPGDEETFDPACWAREGMSPDEAEKARRIYDLALNLQRTHTRVLLRYLGRARACGGFYSPWDGSDGYTVTELKAELAKREHIPDKTEARKIRQEKAKGR